VEQPIAQTTRRVLHGAAVPAGEKLVSLFAPHTAIIRKGKPGRPTQCGRVLWLDEVEGGSSSRYQLLDGKPPEPEQLPRWLAGDRGRHSPANERYAAAQGVRQVVLPKPGAQSAKRIAHERQRWFRRGHDRRSGLEGRSSGLKRRHKLDRCRYHGDAGMERWVGWGIIAHDLRVIATATAR